MFLKISLAIAAAIDTINQTQPDQLIAFTYRNQLLVNDVRADPAWEPWHETLATATVYQPPIRTVDFMRLLTAQERIAIRQSTDPLIIDWRDLLSVTSEVDLADPDVTIGLNYLEQQTLLGTGRAAEILSFVGELDFSASIT